MPSRGKTALKKIFNNLDLVLILFLWLMVFFFIFYRGSNNVGIWGKWENFEIVIPLIISFFISSVIILPIYLVRWFIKNKKKR